MHTGFEDLQNIAIWILPASRSSPKSNTLEVLKPECLTLIAAKQAPPTVQRPELEIERMGWSKPEGVERGQDTKPFCMLKCLRCQCWCLQASLNLLLMHVCNLQPAVQARKDVCPVQIPHSDGRGCSVQTKRCLQVADVHKHEVRQCRSSAERCRA